LYAVPPVVISKPFSLASFDEQFFIGVKMNKMRISAVTLLLILITITANAQTYPKLTDKDCSLIFPSSNFCRITQDAKEMSSCEAWFRGDYENEDEFLGYIFLKPLQHQGKDLSLLVGMTSRGTIHKVRIREMNDINREFLAQFHGKTFDDRFDIARKLEDLLFIPSKLRAMEGNLALSELIAGGVKEIVTSAKKMISRTNIP
jgi:hypothetical protein